MNENGMTQKRTSPLKFGDLAEKSELTSVLRIFQLRRGLPEEEEARLVEVLRAEAVQREAVLRAAHRLAAALRANPTCEWTRGRSSGKANVLSPLLFLPVSVSFFLLHSTLLLCSLSVSVAIH